MLTETDILQLIAECESKLWRLEKEMATFSARHNSTIVHHLECAKQSASNCFDALAGADLKRATLHVEIAFLRADFAIGAFEAERTETLLGESDYLELDSDWRRQCNESVASMGAALKSLREANRSQSK